MSSTPPPPNKTEDKPPSPETMRAVMWEGKVMEVVVRDVPRPTLQLPEDAIVRLTTAAICGSDLHIYHGFLGSRTPPWSMGHEGVGVVVEVGAATEHFKVGDRVIIPAVGDRGFYAAQSALTPLHGLYGGGPDFGDLGGCQAEYVRVPFADDSLIAIPDAFSSDLDWLFLTDIFATGWVGLDFAQFQPGESVAVFGCGPVGLMCIYAATLRGASQVFAVDHVRDRLDKAASLGAIPIDFAHPEHGTASEQILRRRPRGVDRTVDCIGQECVNHRLRPQQNYVVQEAIRVTSEGGGIGLPGLYLAQDPSPGVPRGDQMDKELAVAIPELWNKGLSIKGGNVALLYYEQFPRLFDLVRTGKAKLDWVVSSQVGIEDAPEAYRRFDQRLETKVVIRFPWSRGEITAQDQGEKTSADDGEEVKANGENGVEGGRLPIRTGVNKPRRLLRS